MHGQSFFSNPSGSTSCVTNLKYLEGKEEQEMELESDNLELAKALIESTPQISWEMEAVICEVQARVKTFPNLKITHCRRESNKVAN